jgi:hypothetical protein
MSEAAMCEVAIEEEVLSEVVTREKELPSEMVTWEEKVLSEMVTWEEKVLSEMVTWETVIEEAVMSKVLMSETEPVPMIPCKAHRRSHEQTYQSRQQNCFHLNYLLSTTLLIRRFGNL